MKINKGFSPVVRAVGVLSAVGIIVGGATYAAFASTATLANNSVNAADSNLEISNGGAYAASVEGFAFNDLIPGEFTTDQKFYLRNTGTANVNVTAHVPTQPGTASDYGFTGWENLKVRFTSLDPACTGDNSVVLTDVQTLLGGQVELPCSPLGEGVQGSANDINNAGDYSIAFSVPESALKDGATDISVNDIDFQFTGTVTSEAVNGAPAAPVVNR
jgi:hypothetical protein